MQCIRRPFAAAALAAALLGATGASAAADAPPSGIAVQTDHRSPAAIASHWTPERLRAARPVRVPTVTGATRARTQRQAPEGAPAKTEGSRSRVGGRGAAGRTGRPGKSPFAKSSYFGLELPWNNTSYGTASPINAVGRVYYSAYSRSQNIWYDSYCSGTLVAPNIVLTAAHCIREGRPDGMQNRTFTFAPAVNGTSRPYGTFTSRNQATWTSWYSAPYYNSAGTDSGGGYYGQDYGFVVLDRDALGRHAGDANMAGFYGLLANAPKSDVYHLGYPTEGNWNGCTQSSCRPWHCAAPLQRYSQYATGGKWDIGFSCYTTGGASGGPIFQAYNGRWYVTAALSHMGKVYCQNGANPCLAGSYRYGTTFFGSYLDNDALSLLNFAKTL